MTRATKKTAAKLAELRRLHAAGASAREIARALDLRSHHSALAWMRAAGLEPNGSASRAPRPAAPPAPPAAPSPTSPAAVNVAAIVADADADLPADPEHASAIVRRRLAVVRSILDDLGPLVSAGGFPPTGYAQMVACETALASRLVELTPPIAPDPERDPVSLEAAAKVRARFEKLVDAVEERERAEGRCARCGHALPAAPTSTPTSTPTETSPHVL